MPALPTPTVTDGLHEDRPTAIATLVAAFISDPLMRWMFPEAHTYLTWFPEVLRHYAGASFDHGSAYRAADGSGTALWMPPGVGPDEEALGQVVAQHVDEAIQEDLFALLEQVGASHPDEPHWFLPAIGVDPRAQATGVGSALMAHALTTIDEHGAVAYLESTNPRNIPLYERFGFSVVRQLQVGASPTLTPMIRTAR